MNCLVAGAGGFIGTHLVKRLKKDGHTVRGVDIKYPTFEKSEADEFDILDLRYLDPKHHYFEDVDEVYQLAAEVGGLGYIMDKNHDAEMLRNSMQINLQVLEACRYRLQVAHPPHIFFSSSACVYPTAPWDAPNALLPEAFAYPAHPDNEYAWEKLFAERLYDAYARNYGIEVRIGRLHNTFGPLGTWQGGREKAPAAICRKVAEAPHGGSIEVWGDGTQQRSFTYVDDAVEGIIRLMRSEFQGPVNIGSSRMVTIEEMTKMVIAISTKWIDIKYTSDGPVGVHGRNSDNTLIKDKLGWEPVYPLELGLLHTYQWINQQVAKAHGTAQIL